MFPVFVQWLYSFPIVRKWASASRSKTLYRRSVPVRNTHSQSPSSHRHHQLKKIPSRKANYRSRRTSRSNSDVAVPIPGILDDSAAAPRSRIPLFGRPRANASAASTRVEIILILFADWTPVFVTVMRIRDNGAGTKKRAYGVHT